MPRALIIEDDAAQRRSLADLVEIEGFEVRIAENLEKGRELLGSAQTDVVLCDLILPDGRGTDLLDEVQELPRTEVILITGNASVETAVEALRLGAFDYLTKPVDIPRLKSLLHRVKSTGKLKKEVSSLRGQLRKLGRFGTLVGTSRVMQSVYDLLEKVAPTEASVFLVGESGTGKELAAQTIHDLSKRRSEAFLPVNCGAISANLIESELFGHERGSFTGANRRHQGYFERADGGTLLLDEITEMPIELQVKLLRVLETGTVMRVGGTETVQVDVRVVAASNRDPEKAVEEGRLRQDLLYRLMVFPVRMPPLRERESDIELLAQHFLAELNQAQSEDKRFTDEAIAQLVTHSWPGNVRELKNIVQRAFILGSERIGLSCLPESLGGAAMGTGSYLQFKPGISIADAERRLILATLDDLDGNKRQAAKVLGVSLKTLYNRLNAYAAEEGTVVEVAPDEDEDDSED